MKEKRHVPRGAAMPGARARTAWHVHPIGQTLIVIQGLGRIQQDGQPARDLRPGDVVWIPAGVKHWHGASPVTWLEKVGDADYAGA